MLIIEDSEPIVSRLISLLGNINNLDIIGSTNNGDTGINMIKESVPDLILLDLNLKGTSGLWVIKTIEKKDWKIKVIVLTNHANEYLKELCIKHGAFAFYDKSYEFEAAIHLVNELCDEKS